MTLGKHRECAKLSKEAVFDLQDVKIATSAVIRKLELIANLINDKDLSAWCKLQFGEFMNHLPIPKNQDITQSYYQEKLLPEIKKLGLENLQESVIDRLIESESGGGFQSIETIENILRLMEKNKTGSSADMYRNNVMRTISRVRNDAASRATKLYTVYSLGEIPYQVFDQIRESVDDLLLEICPEAVEKFMSAYNNLSSSSQEDWSLALTCCRRVIKAVADVLFPASTETLNGRSIGEEQYINRLWAFLDKNAPTGSEKNLAKAHVDYLGSFLERLNEKACKGVHATVQFEEAAKAVLYTYLTLGDILEYAKPAVEKSIKENTGLENINTTNIQKLQEAGLNLTQSKEVIKLRAKKPFRSLDELTQINGIGPATIKKLKSTFAAFV